MRSYMMRINLTCFGILMMVDFIFLFPSASHALTLGDILNDLQRASQNTRQSNNHGHSVKNNETYSPSRVYRVSKGVNMRQGPGKNYAVIQTLTRGTEVVVTGIQHGFYRIPLSNGGFGYSYKTFLTYVRNKNSGSATNDTYQPAQTRT